ncbi:DUF1540 domain-containing protein [Angelakisella massiliensis]|uniref:DUF1540 domain-containing protein n=1 Tax=Angelakisella massiliensis TaxID=1871018 RepID=UPI0009F30DE5|nr:DUF1540 domain-containing protein [Angelakisella massiliensis]
MAHKCIDGCECIEYIQCDAKNCVYNDKKAHCTAQQIQVGPASGQNSNAACATFRAEG